MVQDLVRVSAPWSQTPHLIPMLSSSVQGWDTEVSETLRFSLTASRKQCIDSLPTGVWGTLSIQKKVSNLCGQIAKMHLFWANHLEENFCLSSLWSNVQAESEAHIQSLIQGTEDRALWVSKHRVLSLDQALTSLFCLVYLILSSFLSGSNPGPFTSSTSCICSLLSLHLESGNNFL